MLYVLFSGTEWIMELAEVLNIRISDSITVHICSIPVIVCYSVCVERLGWPTFTLECVEQVTIAATMLPSDLTRIWPHLSFYLIVWNSNYLIWLCFADRFAKASNWWRKFLYCSLQGLASITGLDSRKWLDASCAKGKYLHTLLLIICSINRKAILQ